MTDPCPDVRAVQATLRTHLHRPRDPRRLYEELRDRSRGSLAVVVRRHRVTAEGTCAECADPSVPCAPLREVAHDLGLHLLSA